MVGLFVTSVQLFALKSELCCNTRPIEGIVHAMVRWLLEREARKTGADADCNVMMGPFHIAADILRPSAEDATPAHWPMGVSLAAQVAPELVEV